MHKSIVKLGIVAALAGASLAALAQQPITVTVNGRAIVFNGTPPQMVSGRVLVPLRGVFESMGAQVHWTSATQTVDAQRGNTAVNLQIGNHQAHVNGQEVNLDVPPELMNDTTLVPLRFISEALGADVDWLDAQQTVAIRIQMGNEHYAPPPPPPPHRVAVRRPPPGHWMAVFQINAVLPVRLQTPLSSNGNQQGDSFQATIDTGGAPAYRGLPLGTQIVGHVQFVRAKEGNHPGILQLAFDRIQLPDGHSIPVMGQLVGLDNQSVRRDRNGFMIANSTIDRSGKAAFIGYGAGTGVVVSIVSGGHVVRNASIGGVLGQTIRDIVMHPERAQDVRLGPGTPMGVRVLSATNIPQF